MTNRAQESGTFSKPNYIWFGEFLMEVSTRDLRRGAEPIHVEPKVFDVLLTLITHRHRVVTRQELLERHWANESVCDGAVGQCIWSVRKALGDSATAPRYIKTVPRRGYRFVGDVAPESTRLSV